MAARPRPALAGGSEYSVASTLRFHFCNATVYDRSGDSSVVRISAGLDCEPVSPLGSVVMPGSASFFSMNARVTTPRGFGSAAGFCVFQLWILEGATASALATSHPDSVAESFLNIGNVVVRRQDTSRARVQVVKPLVGDLNVAQVLNPGALLQPSRLRCGRSELGLQVALRPWPSSISSYTMNG